MEVRSGETASRYRYLYNAETEEQREFMEHRLQRDPGQFYPADSASAQNTHDMSKSVVVNFSLTANRMPTEAGDLCCWFVHGVSRKQRVRGSTIDRAGIRSTWANPAPGGKPSMCGVAPGRLRSRRYAPAGKRGCWLRQLQERSERPLMVCSRIIRGEYKVNELDLAPEKYPDVTQVDGRDRVGRKQQRGPQEEMNLKDSPRDVR